MHAFAISSSRSRLARLMEGEKSPPLRGSEGLGTLPGSERDDHDRYAEIAASFDAYAGKEDLWLRRTGGYHDLIAGIARSLVPEGERVLEIGCGRADLLAALRPSRGVGVDVSEAMIAAGRNRHPELELHHGAGEQLDLDETFDYIVLTDLIPYVDDLLRLFEAYFAGTRMPAHA